MGNRIRFEKLGAHEISSIFVVGPCKSPTDSSLRRFKHDRIYYMLYIQLFADDEWFSAPFDVADELAGLDSLFT